MADSEGDKRTIRELLEHWAVWRDARLWDRFRTVWHPEGRMWATWFQGTFEEFIKGNDEGWKRGVRILHFLGGSAIDVAGNGEFMVKLQSDMNGSLRHGQRVSIAFRPEDCLALDPV